MLGCTEFSLFRYFQSNRLEQSMKSSSDSDADGESVTFFCVLAIALSLNSHAIIFMLRGGDVREEEEKGV